VILVRRFADFSLFILLDKEMKTFKNFLESKFFLEVGEPPAPGGGIGAPGALPPGGPPMGGGMGAPPPMGGGMGGGMPPPMGGGMGAPPGGGAGEAPNKLKAYNVWDVLERVLGD
jgi:hypothetical protein